MDSSLDCGCACSGSVLADFHSFDLSLGLWTELLNVDIPCARAGPGLAAVGGTLYLFGGNGSKGVPHGFLEQTYAEK